MDPGKQGTQYSGRTLLVLFPDELSIGWRQGQAKQIDPSAIFCTWRPNYEQKLW